MRQRLLKNCLLGLVGTVILGITISLFNATTAPPRLYYSVTDLGTLGDYPFTYPSCINDSGQVVGFSSAPLHNGINYFDDYNHNNHVFLWQNGKMTNLGILGDTLQDHLKINNSGQVVSSALTSNKQFRAFLWQNGQTIYLKPSVITRSSYELISHAQSINNQGQIVGFSIARSVRAVLWQKNGEMTNLGTLNGDDYSDALTINDQGQVFGLSGKDSSEPKPEHIFQWQDGKMTNLGDLRAPFGYVIIQPLEINNKGQVVGFAMGHEKKRLETTAYLWQNGTTTDLGNLGGTQGSAFGINTAGTVVGRSHTSSGTDHAFIWRNGKIRDLNNLLPPNSGWELTNATGINNKGQIVGTGIFNGQKDKGFLLTPVTVSN